MPSGRLHGPRAWRGVGRPDQPRARDQCRLHRHPAPEDISERGSHLSRRSARRGADRASAGHLPVPLPAAGGRARPLAPRRRRLSAPGASARPGRRRPDRRRCPAHSSGGRGSAPGGGRCGAGHYRRVDAVFGRRRGRPGRRRASQRAGTRDHGRAVLRRGVPERLVLGSRRRLVMTGRRLRRLSWVQLAALSAPAFVATGYLVPMAVFMPAFLSEHVGLSLTAVGSILLIGRLWDVFNDPIMGALTDATQTPIGRRRPRVLGGAPLALLATWALYFAKPGMSAASVTAWMIVLFAGWTMVVVAHGAWGAELSDSYDERSRIFGAKTMAVALSLPVFVLGPAILELTGAASPASQMALMGLTVITTLPLAVRSEEH